MTCREARERAAVRAAGGLEDGAALLASHRAACSDCAREAEALAAAWALAGGVPDESAPGAAVADVRRTIRRRAWLRGAAALLVAGIALGGWWASRPAASRPGEEQLMEGPRAKPEARPK